MFSLVTLIRRARAKKRIMKQLLEKRKKSKKLQKRQTSSQLSLLKPAVHKSPRPKALDKATPSAKKTFLPSLPDGIQTKARASASNPKVSTFASHNQPTSPASLTAIVPGPLIDIPKPATKPATLTSPDLKPYSDPPFPGSLPNQVEKDQAKQGVRVPAIFEEH